MPIDIEEGKSVIGAIFRRDTWPDKMSVDFWLLNHNYDADLYRVEESEDNYRVLFPGPQLAQFDPESFERIPAPDGSMGVSIVTGEMHEQLQFDERLRIRLSDYAPEGKQDLMSEWSWFMALHLGTFKHGLSEIEMTQDVLQTMLQNFKKDVLKKGPLPIDYSHNNHEKAAGWIHEADLRNNGTELWVKAKWTQGGLESLKDQEFRFFSAEFEMNYTDPFTGQSYGPIIRGGGLTNIPFLKGTEVYPMSQFSQKQFNKLMEEDLDMDIKTLAEAKDQITQLEERVLELSKDRTRLSGIEERFNEANQKVITLTQESDGFKKEIQKQKKTMEFNQMLSKGEAVEGQRVAFMEDNILEFAKKAVKSNVIQNTDKTRQFSDKHDPHVPEEGGNGSTEYEPTELEQKYMRFGSFSKDQYIKANKLDANSKRP